MLLIILFPFTSFTSAGLILLQLSHPNYFIVYVPLSYFFFHTKFHTLKHFTTAFHYHFLHKPTSLSLHSSSHRFASLPVCSSLKKQLCVATGIRDDEKSIESLPPPRPLDPCPARVRLLPPPFGHVELRHAHQLPRYHCHHHYYCLVSTATDELRPCIAC